ncbi:DUF2147 domain-containing protein [Olleya aquimaris]|uniref:DUF2147 domain-containing protein n=1 Tax=Olleya sediminilitoris TaxID=2795739 RepID=A0ABS1WL25_9FLAO|nr:MULTISPECIES: DUF2147 domain-containing protein [Olleya]AXO81721.1 DUF2147 domain-containing protein [Olleya aquimaris]MBL7559824.1 DUF2147 domain-containing protein [Olleya sediminilitoris]
MKKSILVLAVFLISLSTQAQSIFGQWTTVDDETGAKKSIVEIYKKDGKVFGKIVKIFDPAKQKNLCKKCKGEDYNKPILGLHLIKDMTKDGKYYKHGSIVDPQNGKVYDLRLAVTDEDKLQVRGYIGFLYSTQYWERVQ